MNYELAMSFTHVTESAALAGYQWLGRGNKNDADGAAVAAMRETLNQLPMQGMIVIGEGEIDEAPMLYIGETLGCGGDAIDIAVDPIEGTRMTAMGQPNAIAVLAAAPQGTLLQAPDMYMEKLAVGPKAASVIDLNQPLIDNLKAVAVALEKPLSDLVVAILAKPRHEQVIQDLHHAGMRVYAVPDGDVAASLLTCFDEHDVDVMYGIGGAPEGIISAAALRALGGDMQGRLLPRHQVKGDCAENRRIGADEIHRCQEMGVAVNQVLTLADMAKTQHVMFAATGISHGELVRGVVREPHQLTTETLFVYGPERLLVRIQKTHAAWSPKQDSDTP